MMICHKNMRKIAEMIRNFVAKNLKIYPKKMYTLIRYAGNRPCGAAARGRPAPVGPVARFHPS